MIGMWHFGFRLPFTLGKKNPIFGCGLDMLFMYICIQNSFYLYSEDKLICTMPVKLTLSHGIFHMLWFSWMFFVPILDISTLIWSNHCRFYVTITNPVNPIKLAMTTIPNDGWVLYLIRGYCDLWLHNKTMEFITAFCYYLVVFFLFRTNFETHVTSDTYMYVY